MYTIQQKKNYGDLSRYLIEHNMELERVEFNAVLYAINILTTTEDTKEVCFKLVAEKFPTIKKTFINRILRDMNIVSNAKKKVNKQIPKEMYLLDKEYRDRLLRDL